MKKLFCLLWLYTVVVARAQINPPPGGGGGIFGGGGGGSGTPISAIPPLTQSTNGSLLVLGLTNSGDIVALNHLTNNTYLVTTNQSLTVVHFYSGPTNGFSVGNSSNITINTFGNYLCGFTVSGVATNGATNAVISCGVYSNGVQTPVDATGSSTNNNFLNLAAINVLQNVASGTVLSVHIYTPTANATNSFTVTNSDFFVMSQGGSSGIATETNLVSSADITVSGNTLTISNSSPTLAAVTNSTGAAKFGSITMTGTLTDGSGRPILDQSRNYYDPAGGTALTLGNSANNMNNRILNNVGTGTLSLDGVNVSQLASATNTANLAAGGVLAANYIVHLDTGVTNFYQDMSGVFGGRTNNMRGYISGRYVYTQTAAITSNSGILVFCALGGLSNCIIYANPGSQFIFSDQCATDLPNSTVNFINADGANNVGVIGLMVKSVKSSVTNQSNLNFDFCAGAGMTNVYLMNDWVQYDYPTQTNFPTAHSDAFLVAVTVASHNIDVEGSKFGVVVPPSIYSVSNFNAGAQSPAFIINHGNTNGDIMVKNSLMYGIEMSNINSAPTGDVEYVGFSARYPGATIGWFLNLYTSDLTNAVLLGSETWNNSQLMPGTDPMYSGYDQYSNQDAVTQFPTNGYIFGGLQAANNAALTNGADARLNSLTVSNGTIMAGNGGTINALGKLTTPGIAFSGITLVTNTITLSANTGAQSNSVVAIDTSYLGGSFTITASIGPTWWLALTNANPSPVPIKYSLGKINGQNTIILSNQNDHLIVNPTAFGAIYVPGWIANTANATNGGAPTFGGLHATGGRLLATNLITALNTPAALPATNGTASISIAVTVGASTEPDLLLLEYSGNTTNPIDEVQGLPLSTSSQVTLQGPTTASYNLTITNANGLGVGGSATVNTDGPAHPNRIWF